MRLGPDGAVTGWASLRMQGAGYFDGLAENGISMLPVPLVSPDRQLSRTALSEPTGDRLDRSEVIVVGVPCTVADRATFDAMHACELWPAVGAMDMSAAAGLTSTRRMRSYLGERVGQRWTARVAEALAHADDHSRSPQETRLRLVWVVLAGLPCPLCNRQVFSWEGELLGVPDLLDVEAGLVVEYDGADHLTARRQRDVRREEAFRTHGLEYVTVLAPDVYDRERLAARLSQARARALETRDLRAERWTLQPPPGWRSGPSLDERLDMRDLLATRD